MKVRVAAIAAGLVLMFGLPACGGGGSESTTSSGTATTTAGGGDVAAGREVFISTGCGTCHKLEEAGSTGAVGPDLDTELPSAAEAAGAPIAEFVRTSIVDPDSFVMPRYSVAVMPSTYRSELSETELDDLVAFVVQSAQ